MICVQDDCANAKELLRLAPQKEKPCAAPTIKELVGFHSCDRIGA